MQLDQVDVKKTSKLISEHVDLVTCVQCLKYYTAPETAACGHTLCHLCWVGCTSCPTCHKKVIKKSLPLNMQIKNQTEHIRELAKSFEHLFGIRMDDIAVELAENYQNKHVKEWLSSSQNHFSAPPYSETQTSTQDITLPAVEVSASNIQVHAKTSGSKSSKPPKVVHVPPPQDDWDMIETVPDTEEILEKNKENVVGPMDLEPFIIEDNEYTAGNPRRSSRMRDNKDVVANKNTPKIRDVSVDKQSSNNSSLDTEKKLDKAKQNWTNVKKMRKEFSKLNKENKNKLNVSIEMCKKSKSAVSKQASATSPHSPAKVYTILEDTPNITEEEDTIAKNNDLSNLSENYGQGDKTRKDDHNDINMTEDDELPDKDFNKTKEKSTTKSTRKGIVSKRASQNLINKGKTKEPNKDAINSANDTSNNKMPFVIKSTSNNNSNNGNQNHTVTVDHTNLPDTSNITNDDDIHITIKIGSVITNITINKKRNDVQLNVNSDREVQASLGPNAISHVSLAEAENKKVFKDAQIGTDDIRAATPEPTKETVVSANNKSVSTKKHTASADTATANYEITESVEKELSKIMECDEADKSASNKASLQSKTSKRLGTPQIIPNSVTKSDKVTSRVENTQNLEEQTIDDQDIFNSGSVREVNVQTLKSAGGTQSEILVPTHKTKSKTQKVADKRTRNDDGEPSAKRQRIDTQDVVKETNDLMEMSSENYATIMSQVFANIDADMKVNSKTQTIAKEPAEVETQDFAIKPSQVIPSGKKVPHPNTQVEKVVTDVQSKIIDQKESENMFSTIGNIENPHVAGPETQKHIDNLLTSTAIDDIDNDADGVRHGNDALHINATPAMDDDSDKSVVEDTPQKNNAKTTNNRTVLSNKKQDLNPQKSPDTEDIINITDSIRASNKNDKLENNIPTKTPLTINKFVDEITHKSTPFARKSLNFTQNEMETDDDVTLCPSIIDVAKTTQEKELMKEAFSTPRRKPLQMKNNVRLEKKLVIAGSCLTSVESTNLKILCYKMKWSFVDKYSTDLTHLVVGVDEENKAQRSVKYMCALAAGKWIVSYKWVERCLESNTFINAEPYEALDSTGEPGPRRSRRAKNKVFEGMTFYCMPPFTLLDVDTLKAMLEAAGARVASQVDGVRVKGSSPALLLAEPAHTEEDKYIYLAMDLNIVPVNYEWVLNCLGSYSLCSLLDLLLCPPAILPEATKTWPQELLAVED